MKKIIIAIIVILLIIAGLLLLPEDEKLDNVTKDNPYLDGKYQSSLTDEEGNALLPEYIVNNFEPVPGAPIELARTAIKITGEREIIVDLKDLLIPLSGKGSTKFDKFGIWGEIEDLISVPDFNLVLFTVYDPLHSGTGVVHKDLYELDLSNGEYKYLVNVDNGRNFELLEDNKTVSYKLSADIGTRFVEETWQYNVETGEYTLISEE